MIEKVSRLMLWVVSAADFSDQTLTPGPHVALFMRGPVVFEKANDPHCLKAVLNQGRGNIHPGIFILPFLCCLL